jgi:hypothetical protein
MHGVPSVTRPDPDSHRERASNIRSLYPLQITISPNHHITT